MTQIKYYTRDQLDRAVTVSVPSAAYLLNIGRSTAYRYCDLGIIPFIRIGNRKVVPAEWIRNVVSATGDTSGLRATPAELPPAA